MTHQKFIKRAVITSPFKVDEFTQSVTDMEYPNITWVLDVIKCFHKHFPVFRDGSDPFCQNRPSLVDAVINGSCHLVFSRVAGHLKFRGHGKQGLCSKQIIETLS